MQVYGRLRSLSPRWKTLLAVGAVVLVATLLRVPGLLDDPPGFRHEEATVALAAQQVERGFFPIYFREGSDTVEPAFPYLVNLTGQLDGWGVTGPRLAAALLGIAAAAGCALWYGRVLGPGWALAGGLLVAASFWQIVFSRQAVPSIGMAAAAAFGLWALSRAIDGNPTQDRQTLPSGWYGVAAILFGIGFYTDVTMRAVIPVVLATGVFLLLKRTYLVPVADRRGLLLGAIIMLLVAAPLGTYFLQNPNSFQLAIDRLDGGGIGATLTALVWSGEANPAHNSTSRQLLDPLLAIWGVIGLAVALRRPLQPAHAVTLIWLAGFLVAVEAIAPGNHAQMLAVTPALFLLPLLGMRAAVDGARRRGSRAVTITLAVVVISIAGSAAWSLSTYLDWAGDKQTYAAFSGDVRDAIEALPDDPLPVYFATGDSGRIVRYLAPDRPRRDFDNPDTLPIPADRPAYLAVPQSAGLPGSLASFLGDETLVATGGDHAYRIWFIDDRIRERLPYAVPAVFFEGGPALVGFDVTPAEGDEPAIEVVQVHLLPDGGETYIAHLRLMDTSSESSSAGNVVLQPAPARLDTGDEIILSRTIVPFPDTPTMVADLQAAVQLAGGDFLQPHGPNIYVVHEIFVVLNAIGYIGPEP